MDFRCSSQSIKYVYRSLVYLQKLGPSLRLGWQNQKLQLSATNASATLVMEFPFEYFQQVDCRVPDFQGILRIKGLESAFLCLRGFAHLEEARFQFENLETEPVLVLSFHEKSGIQVCSQHYFENTQAQELPKPIETGTHVMTLSVSRLRRILAQFLDDAKQLVSTKLGLQTGETFVFSSTQKGEHNIRESVYTEFEVSPASFLHTSLASPLSLHFFMHPLNILVAFGVCLMRDCRKLSMSDRPSLLSSQFSECSNKSGTGTPVSISLDFDGAQTQLLATLACPNLGFQVYLVQAYQQMFPQEEPPEEEEDMVVLGAGFQSQPVETPAPTPMASPAPTLLGLEDDRESEFDVGPAHRSLFHDWELEDELFNRTEILASMDPNSQNAPSPRSEEERRKLREHEQLLESLASMW